MDKQRFNNLIRLFEEACRLEPVQREEFVQRSCGDDLALQEQLRAMLRQDETPIPAIDSTQPGEGVRRLVEELSREDLDSEVDPSEGYDPPRWVGRYRLLRLVGRGGMGSVYEAEQEQPKRRVALKMIRPELASPGLLRRFARETEILGRLQHPGIAQIFEAGTADSGTGPQPFFAMEFVDGRPILDFARANDMSTPRRINLFVDVCRAVEHAHAHGVVHRDLKPANILVPTNGVPKVLDFGVARITGSEFQMTTLHTDVGQLIGTVPYMSPEQVIGRSDDIDTRTDVYALGVILYELLAEQHPFDLRDCPLPAAVRVISEEDPTPLSSVNRLLRGDLETIVAKSMEKSRDRRYPSAGALADDLERHLRDEPIHALPAGTWYQFRKFARRNRAFVFGLVSVMVTLIAGMTGTTTALMRARRAEQVAAERLVESIHARERAEVEAEKARRINDFLQEMLSAADPIEGRGTGVTLASVLEEAARQVDLELADQPDVAASVHQTLGTTYTRRADFVRGAKHLSRSLQLRQSLYGVDSLETADSLGAIGEMQFLRGDLPAAESTARRVLEVRRRQLGDDHVKVAEAMNAVALSLVDQGRFVEAEESMRQSLAIRMARLGREHREVAANMDDLARLKQTQGDLNAALELLREAARIYSRVLHPRHPRVAVNLNHQAFVHFSLGDYARAEGLVRQALNINREVYGPDHPETASTIHNLGVLLRRMGQLEVAEDLATDALRIRTEVLGANHADTAITLQELGRILAAQNRFEDAEDLFGQAIAVLRSKQDYRHPNIGRILMAWARVRVQREDYVGAEPLYEDAVSQLEPVLGDRNRDVIDARLELASLLADRGAIAEAIPLYRNVLEAQEAMLPEGDPGVLWTRNKIEQLTAERDGTIAGTSD